MFAHQRPQLARDGIEGWRAFQHRRGDVGQPLNAIGQRTAWLYEGFKRFEDGLALELHRANLDDAVALDLQARRLDINGDAHRHCTWHAAESFPGGSAPPCASCSRARCTLPTSRGDNTD